MTPLRRPHFGRDERLVYTERSNVDRDSSPICRKARPRHHVPVCTRRGPQCLEVVPRCIPFLGQKGVVRQTRSSPVKKGGNPVTKLTPDLGSLFLLGITTRRTEPASRSARLAYEDEARLGSVEPPLSLSLSVSLLPSPHPPPPGSPRCAPQYELAQPFEFAEEFARVP